MLPSTIVIISLQVSSSPDEQSLRSLQGPKVPQPLQQYFADQALRQTSHTKQTKDDTVPTADAKQTKSQYMRSYMQKRRADDEYHHEEQQRNTAGKKRQRQNRQTDLDVKQMQKERDKEYRRKRRADPAVRLEENVSKQDAYKKKSADPSLLQKQRTSNQEAQRKRRLDSTVQQKERTDKQAKRRQHPTEIRVAEKERRQQRRSNPEIRARERASDQQHRAIVRSLPSTADLAIKLFKSAVQHGPSYICVSCNRLLYKTTVTKYDASQYKDMPDEILSICITDITTFDEVKYICSACKVSLKKNQIPLLSVGNNLWLHEIPAVLKDLNALEVTFIARRIPFMKLLALPRGKQRSVHGCVVNIPVEPEQSVSILPRVPSSSSMITVKLKRKLQYRGHVFSQNIRPHKIIEALHYLKFVLKNPLYDDVVINQNWEVECQSENPDDWNCLTAKIAPSENDPAAPTTATSVQVSTDDSDPAAPTTVSSAQDSTDEEGDDPVATEDERSRLSGIQFSTCIQPKDLSSDANLVLTIAPGEGKHPKAFYEDTYSEELSFPHLFPDGKFGFSADRMKKLSMKKYFQSRLLHYDGRFAQSTEYLFYAQFRCEAKK